MSQNKNQYSKYQELITESIKQLREISQLLQTFENEQIDLKYEPNENDSDKQCIQTIETILQKLQIIASQKSELLSKSTETIRTFKRINSLVKEYKNTNKSEMKSIENYSSNLYNVLLEKEEKLYQSDISQLEEQSRKRKIEYMKRKEDITKKISQFHSQLSENSHQLSPSKNITVTTVNQSHTNNFTSISNQSHSQGRSPSFSPIFSNVSKSTNSSSSSINQNNTIVDTLEIIDMKEFIDLKNQEVFICEFDNDDDISALESVDQSMMTENDIIREENIKQIEEWTHLSYEDVVFDTSIDQWSKGNSNFSQKLLGKENLVFLIQDEKKNEFGCYVKSQIIKTDSKINDTSAFVFSLYSNGRSNQPIRFEMNNQNDEIFCLYADENPSWLFGIGNSYLFDIGVSKKGIKADHCVQSSFDYLGYSDILIGEKKFIPKRMVVIQLK